MRSTQAWEMLHNPEHSSSLTMTQLYDLMLRAGYSEEVAQQVANQRGCDRMDAGMAQ